MREPDRRHAFAKTHGVDDRPARDDRRDAYLTGLGIHVERIAAVSVLSDPHAVAYGVRELAAERIAILG